MTALALATWLALSPAGDRLSVQWDEGGPVEHFDARSGRPMGKSAAAPPGRYRLDRFAGTLTFLAAPARTIALCREPYAAVETPDGRRLFVACLLPEQSALADRVAARVVAVDVAARAVAASIPLPNGATGVRGIAVSPDGRWVYVAHILARYTVHASQLEQGWMNTNALSVVDARALKRHATVLLDDVDRGAANPWGVAVSGDGKKLWVTHAGTHDLSAIDVPAMMAKAAAAGESAADAAGFLLDIRERIALPGKGPRAVAVSGGKAWVAEYFTRTVALVEGGKARTLARGAPPPETPEWRGGALFHDASLSLQQWQSCSSCHPDGRADGLNWDLLNDGLGNPKNTRSLLNAHLAGPVMWTGVRPSASYAVRSGMKHILFTEPSEDDANAIEAWLRSLRPVAVRTADPAAVERGRKLFFGEKTGCAACHPPPLYTDNAMHDVCTHGPADFLNEADGKRSPQLQFKTPSLIEIRRTAPYLHDGRYATLEETLAEGNRGDCRGRSSQLGARERKDLVEFLRSL